VIRLATLDDIPELTRLIAASVRILQATEYTESQRESALKSVYGVDTQLIADGTYFAAEIDGAIAGCGGWSKRKTLFGGDIYARREDSLLDPATDAAKIRAFFIHPDYARRGIGTAILRACETAAIAEGFRRLEMGATLTGIAFYKTHGYREMERIEVPLENAETMGIVRMGKDVECDIGGTRRDNVAE
jgi:GNAT superfamily N-acetyltransferase